MKASILIERLKKDGIELYLKENKLCYRAYEAPLSAENRELIAAHRSSLVAYLNRNELHGDALPKEISSDDFEGIVEIFKMLANKRNRKQDVQVDVSNHIHVAS